MLVIVTAFPPCHQGEKAVVGTLWRDWSHLWQAELFQVSIQESSTGSEWRDNPRKVLRRAWQNVALMWHSSWLIVKQRESQQLPKGINVQRNTKINWLLRALTVTGRDIIQ